MDFITFSILHPLDDSNVESKSSKPLHDSPFFRKKEKNTSDPPIILKFLTSFLHLPVPPPFFYTPLNNSVFNIYTFLLHISHPQTSIRFFFSFHRSYLSISTFPSSSKSSLLQGAFFFYTLICSRASKLAFKIS